MENRDSHAKHAKITGKLAHMLLLSGVMLLLLAGTAIMRPATVSADMVCDESGDCYPVDQVPGGKGGTLPTNTPTATPTNTPVPTRTQGPVNVLSDPNATPEAATEAMRARKEALVAKYAQVGNGTLSMQQYNAELDAFLNAAGITYTELHHPDHIQNSEDCAGIPASKLTYSSDGSCYDASEGTYTSTSMQASVSSTYPYAVRPKYMQRILWNVPHIAQNNSYYCGPAAAQAIITYWAVVNRKSRNSVFGDPLSQVFLAVQCNQAQAGCDDVYGKFLQTEEYKETLWNYPLWEWSGNTIKRIYHYPMQRGINRWRQNDEFGGDYLPVGPPGSVLDKNKMHDHWITDIDAAFPLVFDVHENTLRTDGTRTPRLPGHPTDRPISHWFAVRGYSVAGYYDNKDWVHYVDSAYGGQGFTVYPNQPWRNYTLTQGNQRVTFDDVYEMMKVRGYGYVW